CNAVLPGVIETDMTADVAEGLVGAVPAGRGGQPADVAACVAFLCSEEASYVNGATLAVDGGLAAWTERNHPHDPKPDPHPHRGAGALPRQGHARRAEGPRRGAGCGVAREVVITGRGVVAPVGEGAEAFFDALTSRRSGVADGVAACLEFDPEGWMTPKEARRTDRYAQFALAAADQAAAE